MGGDRLVGGQHHQPEAAGVVEADLPAIVQVEHDMVMAVERMAGGAAGIVQGHPPRHAEMDDQRLRAVEADQQILRPPVDRRDRAPFDLRGEPGRQGYPKIGPTLLQPHDAPTDQARHQPAPYGLYFRKFWHARRPCTVRLMGWQQRALDVLRPAVTMLVIGLSLVAALSWLATWHWAFVLLAHFHVYFLLAGAALAVAAITLRQGWTAVLSSLVVAVSLSVVWPQIHLPPTDLQPRSGGIVRLIWANLHHRHTDLGAMRSLIEAEKPAIVVLTELDPVHDAVLRDVARLLPYQSPPPRANVFGIMLLATKPPEALKFDLTMGDHAPLMVARLCPVESGCLTLLGLHAWRPGPSSTAARDRQLAHAATVARRHVDEGERVVLVGDFNLTPFSPVFDRLLAQSELWDTAILPAERPRASPAIATWWLANTGSGCPSTTPS